MRLTMAERRVLIKSFAPRYRKKGKKVKGEELTEFTQMTGYNRCYGAYLLRLQGRCVWLSPKVVALGDVGKKAGGQRARKYDQKVVEALKMIWKILDYVCGKRLVAILPEVVPILERHGELKVDANTRERLIQISAATIDRLLEPERRKHQLKGRSGTKPGTLLKHQIPIKRFADWQEDRPGFVEVDLVGHEGGQGRGDYCQTLDVTDVYTGWTEVRAVRNKAQVWVLEAMKLLRQRSPFPWLGIGTTAASSSTNT